MVGKLMNRTRLHVMLEQVSKFYLDSTFQKRKRTVLDLKGLRLLITSEGAATSLNTVLVWPCISKVIF